MRLILKIILVLILVTLVGAASYFLRPQEPFEDMALPNYNQPQSVDLLGIVKLVQNNEVSLQNIDLNGHFKEIINYNQKIDNGISVSYLFPDQPLIYISKIGSNYKVVDFNGQDLSPQYFYLQNASYDFNNFAVIPNSEKVVYSFGPGEGQVEDKNLFIADYQNQVQDYIYSNLLPNDIISVTPIGWSQDKQYLYLTKIGWEGFDYADLWKVNISTKEVIHINEAEKVGLGYLSVLPDQDLAIGAAVASGENDDWMGGFGPEAPAQLQLFNLKDNTVTTIVDSPEHLLLDPILSPDGQKIFYTEELSDDTNITYQVDLSGQNKKEIGENIAIKSISAEGDYFIIQQRENPDDYDSDDYRLFDLDQENYEQLSFPNNLINPRIQFLSCPYPLGYSCLYK